LASASVTSATAGTLISNLWSDQIEYAANDVRGVVNFVTDTGERWFGPGGGNILFPNVGSIAATAYGAGTTVLTFTANTEGVTTVNPLVIYTGVELYEDFLNTSIVDAVKAYAPVLAEGLYQHIEETILGKHATTVTTVGSSAAGYNFLEADFLTGLAQLHANGKDKVVPGKIYGIYHPLQYDNMMAISNIVSASVRGETNGPAKTGVIGMSNGTNIFFTTNVALTSATICNLLIVPKWLILARKNRPKIEMERSNLATKVIASTQYGVTVQWSNCAVRHATMSL
jgi:hypothetical protein